jgi:hypothetical protein
MLKLGIRKMALKNFPGEALNSKSCLALHKILSQVFA